MGIFSKSKDKTEDVKPEPVLETSVALVKEAPKPAVLYFGKQVLIKPILTEKGTHLASQGKYVFAVRTDANKPEIKKAIQKIYSVHVTEVKIINSVGKKRNYGKARGITSAMKKAIVVLKEGEKLPGIIESVG